NLRFCHHLESKRTPTSPVPIESPRQGATKNLLKIRPSIELPSERYLYDALG
ncbi:unnamed protein product, partial [Musa acuminata subsp. burmannicoides]